MVVAALAQLGVFEGWKLYQPSLIKCVFNSWQIMNVTEIVTATGTETGKGKENETGTGTESETVTG